jgi:hypothetical protein
MPVPRIVTLVAMMVVGVIAPVAAQVRADPGTMINGRVAVRVNVTLSDDETPYAPIGGVSLRFFRTTADTTIAIRTDEAGTATALLLSGEYRLISTSPVEWKGTRYSWSQLVQVRAGLPTIELTAGLADRSAIPVAAASLTATDARTSGSKSVTADGLTMQKDPAMGTMLSFFIPGSGQIYAGERVKGGALLAVAAVGVGVATHQLSCATAADCESTTGGMALGAAGTVAFFGSWIYGILDAGDAARRFNSSHGLVVTAIEPVVIPIHGRGARFGLAVRVSR